MTATNRYTVTVKRTVKETFTVEGYSRAHVYEKAEELLNGKTPETTEVLCKKTISVKLAPKNALAAPQHEEKAEE